MHACYRRGYIEWSFHRISVLQVGDVVTPYCSGGEKGAILLRVDSSLHGPEYRRL